jgi:hypothetical protein
LIPHRQDAFYQGGDRKGMKDLYSKPAAIAGVCVTCHVLGSEDKDIAAAGHPTGANFDAGKKLQAMAHWPSDEAEGVSSSPRRRAYDASFYSTVLAQAKPLLAARVQALGNLPAPPPAPKAPSESAPKAAASTEEFRELKPGELIKLIPDAPTGAYAPPPPVREVPAPAAPQGTAPGLPAPPRPPTPSMAGSAQEQAAAVLVRLVREKKRLDIPPPGKARAEGDELRSLEDDVFALALEVLRKP